MINTQSNKPLKVILEYLASKFEAKIEHLALWFCSENNDKDGKIKVIKDDSEVKERK
jgi:hypothetical protein